MSKFAEGDNNLKKEQTIFFCWSWHMLNNMPTSVPFEHTNEVVDSGGGGVEEIIPPINPGPSKPEAIVRPLRRREPSDDDHRSPEIEDLEAQIIQNLNKLEKQDKLKRQLSREGEKKSKEFFKRKDVSRV